ncbi:unnamed protein product [Schistocephalus solidus]|uniref:C2H2-type domain-containing protein n=1 Tax=Schistocephalus solidus TaxID=70667 RepID=A0A183SE81_SCHSO|nr:unnamed protein product [Schistocephalus solidus]
MEFRTDAIKAAFLRCRHHVQQRLREMQGVWMVRKAEEIQGHADRNEMKNCFKAIKAIYGPCIKGTAPRPRPRSPTPSSSTPCADHSDEHHLSHSHHLRSHLRLPATINAPSTSDGDSVLTCPHCHRTFASHIGLIGHLRIHRTETGELVSGAPTRQFDRRSPTMSTVCSMGKWSKDGDLRVI